MRNYQKLCKLLKQEADITSGFSVDSSIPLTYEQLAAAALSPVTFKMDGEVIAKNHAYIQKLARDRKAVYGLTTSFGGNIHHIIPPEEAKLLQRNLILSHATNVGDCFPYEISKAAFVLRIHTLAQGYSGISSNTLGLATSMASKGLVPVINIHGSLGASGDIAPLAAIALTLIGEGNLWLPDKQTTLPAKEALSQYGMKPVELSYKEGLALLNGTSMMTGVASINAHYLKRLLENSLVVGAMSLEALRASTKPFDKRLHTLKPHRYQINTARIMEAMLQKSHFTHTHDELKSSIEKELETHTEAFYSKTDLQGGSYSLRAIPQIYHPILSNFETFTQTINTEINAIDDNPIILSAENDELHGANFHGYAIAVASDALNLSAVGVSNLALARIDRLLKSPHSHLPWFLATGKEGLYLGMHGIQFTATGIGAELRDLSTPISIHQLPTNNDNQDFVSFGLQSTVKGLEMTMLCAYVVAIEWMCAAQGLWILINNSENNLSIQSLSPVTRRAYEDLLRIYTPALNQDQTLNDKVEALADKLLLESFLPGNLQTSLWS